MRATSSAKLPCCRSRPEAGRGCSSSSIFLAFRPGGVSALTTTCRGEPGAAGEISHVAVTGRFPMAEPFRETGFFIPADLPQAHLEGALEVATAALRALGVRAGDCHTEIKFTPSGPQVIEVNGRLGGGIPEMLFHASGVSLLRLSMRVALG